MTHKLFIYGTLGPGRPNEHVMTRIGGSWQEASVTGTLHEGGWGAAMGYPGITLDENGGRVKGFLFSSDNLPAHWAELDAFEGEGYQRVLTTVTLQDGTHTQAFIYTLAH